MDPKEKAQYLIDKGYIEGDSFFKLAEQIEAVQEIKDTPKVEYISSATSNIVYTYEMFLKGLEKITEQIRSDRWQPDYIVGIVRGGSVPAIYLSHRLKIPVVMLQWSTRDVNLPNECNAWIPEDVNMGKNVLIIEDIVDSGITIKEVLADWNKSIHEELKLANIRIAAMINNVSQDVKVDYCDVNIDRNVDKRWVELPWEAKL